MSSAITADETPGKAGDLIQDRGGQRAALACLVHPRQPGSHLADLVLGQRRGRGQHVSWIRLGEQPEPDAVQRQGRVSAQPGQQVLDRGIARRVRLPGIDVTGRDDINCCGLNEVKAGAVPMPGDYLAAPPAPEGQRDPAGVDPVPQSLLEEHPASVEPGIGPARRQARALRLATGKRPSRQPRTPARTTLSGIAPRPARCSIVCAMPSAHISAGRTITSVHPADMALRTEVPCAS